MQDPKNDDNNSETGSIKSTDFNLQFLEYDSDDDDEPKLQDKDQDDNKKEEEEEEIHNKIEKENNSEEDEINGNNSRNSNFACAYCGLSSETHLAQCLECKKWFCNGKTTHIVPRISFFI